MENGIMEDRRCLKNNEPILNSTSYSGDIVTQFKATPSPRSIRLQQNESEIIIIEYLIIFFFL